MLAKWVDFVIPSAHAFDIDAIANDDSWLERWAEAREQMGEQTRRTQQAQAEAQQAVQERIKTNETMISLVDQLWIKFEGELEEKWNEIVKYWTQENLSNDKVREITWYIRDIRSYIDANY